MYFTEIAISQMERIRKDDPKKQEAFDKMLRWINESLTAGEKINHIEKTPDNVLDFRPKYVSIAQRYANMAIAQLEAIRRDLPDRNDALDSVIRWIEDNRVKSNNPSVKDSPPCVCVDSDHSFLVKL